MLSIRGTWSCARVSMPSVRKCRKLTISGSVRRAGHRTIHEHDQAKHTRGSSDRLHLPSARRCNKRGTDHPNATSASHLRHVSAEGRCRQAV